MPDTDARIESRDGTQIAVHATGTGAPVVLVHGTACDHRVWRRVARRLSDAFSLHMMDRRGRGDSEDGLEYALEREVEDVVSVAEALEQEHGEPVAVVGHSLGGVLALEAAAASSAVDRVGAYEPPVYGRHGPPEEAVARLERLLEEKGPEAVAEAFLSRVGYSKQDLEGLRRNEAVWSSTVQAAPTIPRESRALLGHELSPARFRSVSVPVWLGVGGESPPMYRDSLARVKGVIDQARVHVIQGARHSVHVEAPERFVNAVHGFLEETGSSSP